MRISCRLLLLACFVALLSPCTASANVIGTNVIAQPVTRARIESLPRKERKAWLNYLARSEKQKVIDKQTLQEEQKRAGNTSPKHAPSGRGAYALRIDHPADWYAGDAALQIARNIISYQVPDGGWSKNIDMTSGPRAPGDLYDADNLNRFSDATDFDKPVNPNWHYIATLDNDSTWMQIHFLARITTALLAAHRDADAAPLRASVEHGVEYLLNAQYPNGGWPQVWPLEGGYHDAITVNDNAMLHAIEILESVANRTADFTFLTPALAHSAGPAAERGIECLLKLQIAESEVKTAWAQQYDALTLQPTSARNYEMAALCSDESFPIVEFLMQQPNPSPAEIAAVHAAASWFAKVEISGYRYGSGDFRADRNSPDGRKLVAAVGAGPLWARYYQIGTDKPIFGDRDKTIHDDVNELSRERRNGYAWFNTAGVAVLAEYKTWATAHPVVRAP
jgi:PelA/Pel-15E family pectate lyase